MVKIALASLLAAAALAQIALAPRFEVASIKPAPDLATMLRAGKAPHIGTKIDAARVDIGFMGLTELICLAYKVKPYQVTGPEWMKAARFDVLARIPEGVSKDLVPEMMQALLADRFKLTLHRETKDHAGYALLVAKGGPKFKESVAEEPVSDKDATPPTGPVTVATGNNGETIKTDSKGGATIAGGPYGTQRISFGPEGIHTEYSKMTMPGLAELLTSLAGGTLVVDMTEVKGTWQVVVDIPTPTVLNGRGAAAGGAGGPIGGDAGNGPAGVASDPENRTAAMFQAVQKMGLKLEQRKIPMETIIIDHVDKTPTEN